LAKTLVIGALQKVPNLLGYEQRRKTCTEFVAAMQRHNDAGLNHHDGWDDGFVSVTLPRPKNKTVQELDRNGTPDPIKARVHASRTKQMLLAFLDSKGLVYTHIVQKGTTINTNYILVVLSKFLDEI
jgi:hypothetical protein